MSRYERSFSAMGSSFYICIDASIEASYAGPLLDKLVARTEQLEQVMSRFREQSELVLLNRRVSQTVSISPTLRDVLNLASLFHGVSSGAFDPRILPGLERIGYTGASVENLAGESSATTTTTSPEKAFSDMNTSSASDTETLFDVVREPGEIRLHYPLDLGGIGKGYTSDRLADVVAASIAHEDLYGYIVDAGGDIVLSGQQENGDGWSIGIEDPYGTAGELAAAIQLPWIEDRLAVCTSSLKRRSWEHEGKRVHHILDPKTKMPVPTHLQAVTALGASAAYTEVFTKCKMISEGTNAYPWLSASLPYVAIGTDEVLSYTEDIAPFLSWVSGRYQNAKVVP